MSLCFSRLVNLRLEWTHFHDTDDDGVKDVLPLNLRLLLYGLFDFALILASLFLVRDRRHKITLDVVIREGEVDGDLFVRLTLGHLRVLLVEDLLPRHEKIFHLVKQFCLWQVGVALYLFRVRKSTCIPDCMSADYID